MCMVHGDWKVWRTSNVLKDKLWKGWVTLSGNQGTEYLKDWLAWEINVFFFLPAWEIKNAQAAGCLWRFLSSIFVLQYQEGGKIFKVKKDLSYLNIRTFCQLGHGSTLKNQETLLTDDLDITAGAKEKASQLKDLDGSTWWPCEYVLP